MAHNGKLAQINIGFLQTSGAYPFINHVKTAHSWTLQDNSGRPLPDILDVNAYPLDETPVYTVFYIPPGRPGNWVCRWTGSGEVNQRIFTHAVVDGSVSGTNGRFVMSITQADGRIHMGFTSVNGDPITDIAFLHEDDEAAWLAGEVFSPKFKQMMSRFGVFRSMDLQYTNTTNISVWSQMPPESAAFYDGQRCPPGMFKGTTTNVGDDYTIAGVGVPADKDTICLKWNATASGNNPTLNGIIIKDFNGDAHVFATRRPTANRLDVLFYDADLACWMNFADDSNVSGIRAGVPISLIVRLCNEVGMHPWLHVPYLALDPPTDFATQLATYCRDNLDPGLVPRFEAANEVWNSSAGFNATRYGWNKGFVRWGLSAIDHHNWYGRVLPLMGKAISDVYGGDRSRYRMMCGVQTSVYTTTSTHDARLESTNHVGDGGDPASDWVTHLAITNYFSGALTGGGTVTASQELAYAYDYSQAADDEARTTIIEAYVNAGVPTALVTASNALAAWKAWSEAHGVMGKINYYEGGYSPDYPASDSTATIDNISQAAQAVVTMNSGQTVPVAGMQLSIAGVVGMTEVNGNTYDVVSVDGLDVTIDVDSTGFTAYASGGTVTYVGTKTMRTNLRRHLKRAPSLEGYLLDQYSRILWGGGEYPSCFVLAGTLAWSVWDPDIYASETPSQWEAIDAFATTTRPKRLTLKFG